MLCGRQHVVHERHEDVPVVEGGGTPGAAAEMPGVDPDERARDRSVELAALQRRLVAPCTCTRGEGLLVAGALRVIWDGLIAWFSRHCYLWLT